MRDLEEAVEKRVAYKFFFGGALLDPSIASLSQDDKKKKQPF